MSKNIFYTENLVGTENIAYHDQWKFYNTVHDLNDSGLYLCHIKKQIRYTHLINVS